MAILFYVVVTLEALNVLNHCFILALNDKEISKNLIYCKVIDKLFNKISDDLFEKLAQEMFHLHGTSILHFFFHQT